MVKCLLDSPHLPKDHTVHKILRLLSPNVSYVTNTTYWGPGAFFLDKSELYQNLSLVDQDLVLRNITKSLLEEAYFIEKAGIAFAAKMVILSETLEEREMYSHFCHEEANHLTMIEKFLIDRPNPRGNLFLPLLTDLIESGDKQCLTYFIQIVLEGLGLHHYQGLKVGCLEPTLVNVLDLILKDEALHYRSGLALYDPNSLTYKQRVWIGSATSRFRDYVTMGPIRTINSILKVTGKIHIKQYNQLLLDIKAKEQTQAGLDLLESLIKP